MFNFLNKLRFPIFCIAALFCFPLALQAQGPLVVVIEPTGNVDVTTINKMSVRGTLEEYIASTKKHRVLNRAHTDQLLQEHSFEWGKLPDYQIAFEICKILQADVFLTQFREEDGRFVVICSLVTRSFQISNRVELIEANSLVAILNAVERAARLLVGPPAIS